MPVNLKRYPPYWKQFSRYIRWERAAGRCECSGQCGLHGGPNGNRRCEEVNHRPAKWAKGRVVLTTAHLCSCDPPCSHPTHVIAACQRCHLRIDRHLHARNRIKNGTQRTPDWVRLARNLEPLPPSTP